MRPWNRHILVAALAVIAVTASASTVHAAGDAEAGSRVFRSCIACHSLEPGRHMTGPSLAGIWGKPAGSAQGFERYSEALQESGIVWGEHTLDAWLADPQALIPGNRMTFPGIDDPKARADLVAFLSQAAGGESAQEAPESGGAMRGPEMAGLKAVGPEQRITAIRYCGDTYRVSTEAGETLAFWEFNLRFKTDSSDKGPRPGRPVILGAGMMGDRAQAVFAHPAEISDFIRESCD